MIEKKDPPQESTETDPFDDDDIIDLTEEVKTTSEDDADIIEVKPAAVAYTAKTSTPYEPPTKNGAAETEFTEDEDLFTEDDEDIIASAIDRFGKAEDADDAMLPDDEFDFEFDDDNDHFMGEDQEAEGKDEFVALGDDESMEMLEEEDAFDFEEELDLEFEADADESEIIDASEDDAEEKIDITVGVAEELPASVAAEERFEPAGDIPTEAENAMDIFALTEEETLEPETPAEVFEFDAETESLDDDDLDITALISDQEEDDDHTTVFTDESAAAVAGEEDEIIEITEFDQHFAGETDELSETASVLDESDLEEEEFISPIEIEENSALVEELGELREAEAEIPSADMSRLFSDAGAEPSEPAGRSAEIFETSPAFDPELPAETAATAEEIEKFSFDMETKEISAQIDRLDTFLSEESASEPAVALLPGEQPAKDGRSTDDFQKSALKNAVMELIPERLDTAIERFIDEKYSGKIENIIYEVIEKAVSKEIDRLKAVLLENDINANRH